MDFTKLRKIPAVGTTCNMFDDGKIRYSRLGQCIITDVIKFNDAEEDLKEIWKHNRKEFPWIFLRTTDYFIKATVLSLGEEYKDKPMYFARDKYGYFFTLSADISWQDFNNEYDDIEDIEPKYYDWDWFMFQLDIDGSLMEYLEDLENKINNRKD